MKHRILSVLATVLLMALLGTGAMAADSPEVSAGRQYIVGYRETAQMLSEDADGVPFDVVDGDRLQALLAEGAVEWYEEDYPVTLFDDACPVELAEESRGKMAEARWELSLIQAELAWRIDTVGQEIRVGVIDSGVNPGHADLTGNVVEGYNYVEETTDTRDTLGHGTFVSGIIAALDDGSGITGVAPGTQIVPLKCFSGKTTSVSHICRAIYGAVDDFGCDVINLSLGLSENSQALETAVDYAAGKGVILVAAVGNYSGQTLYYPAAYDSVIGVGAVDQQGNLASTSQRNSSVFVTAPGVSVRSTSLSGGYATGSGTSYATPYVTAAVAVMKSVRGALSLPEAMNALSVSATDRGEPGYDSSYGYGILNLEGCLKLLLEGIGCYISPVETDGTTLSAVVYNNTDGDFSGKLVVSSHNGTVLQKLSAVDLTLSPGSTETVQVPAGKYTTRLFVWNSFGDNRILSNTRTDYREVLPEEEPELLSVVIDLRDWTGQAFSLLASTGGEPVYAIQRQVPEDGVFEMRIPGTSLGETPETGWDAPLTLLVNGTEYTISPHTHTYGDPGELLREDTGQHRTVYICSLCGCAVERLPETPDEPMAFSDVAEGAWYYDYVRFAAENGLMVGVSGNRFAPNETLDRGMFVTILYRMAGEPAVEGSMPFADVPPTAYYAKAVQWAVESGIVMGVSDREFQPKRGIRRQEIAAMAFRYAAWAGCDTGKRTVLSYTDGGSISKYALEAVQWAAAEGVMIGDNRGLFHPMNTATRAEAAALCMRLYEKTR